MMSAQLQPQQQQADVQNVAAEFASYENPDMSNWKPPRILHYEDEQGNDHLLEFDPKNIMFGVPKSRPNNAGSTVPVDYHLVMDGKDLMVPLRLQTPKMRSMWGLSSKEFAPRKAGEAVQSGTRLDLTFRDKDKYAALDAFYKAMFLVDQRILIEAKKRVRQWFSNAKQLEKQLGAIDLYYKSITRLRERKKDQRMFAPSLTMKARKLRGGHYNFNCFNEQLQLIPGDSIVGGTDCIAKLELTSLWFSDNSFGPAIDLKEVLMFKSRFRKTPSIVATVDDGAVDLGGGDAVMDMSGGGGYVEGDIDSDPAPPPPQQQQQASMPGFVSASSMMRGTQPQSKISLTGMV
jgi:hypothetical protein